MAANSKQGWSLFSLVIGFTLLVGGLAALSEGAARTLATLGSLVGIVLVAISCATFYKIKPLEKD